MKVVTVNVKFKKENSLKTHLIQFHFFIFDMPDMPACLQQFFHGRVLSIRVFVLCADGVPPRINTVASRDQF